MDLLFIQQSLVRVMKFISNKLLVFSLVLSSLLSNTISMNGRCAPSIDIRIWKYLVFIDFFGFSPVKYESRFDGFTIGLQFLRADSLQITIANNCDTVDLLLKANRLSPRCFVLEDSLCDFPTCQSIKIKKVLQNCFIMGERIIFDDRYLSCSIHGHFFSIVPNSFDYFSTDNKRKYNPVNKELIHKADSLLKDSTVLDLVDSSSVSLVKRVLELVDNSAE